MKIQYEKFSLLTGEEMIFIYSMLRKYGEMAEAKERTFTKKQKNKFKQNNKKPKPIVRKESKYPDLYDFNDPKWEKCEDKNFLVYRVIMERAGD